MFIPLDIQPDIIMSAVDIRLARLAAKLPDGQGILLSIFDKVRTALPELKTHLPPDALFPDEQHPFKIKRTGILIRLSARDYEFNTIHIPLNVYSSNQGLADDAFMPNG